MSLSNPYDWTIQENESGTFDLLYQGQRVGELDMSQANAEEVQGALNSTRTEIEITYFEK